MRRNDGRFLPGRKIQVWTLHASRLEIAELTVGICLESSGVVILLIELFYLFRGEGL